MFSVPVRSSEILRTIWLDLYQALYRSRVLFLTYEIQDEMANDMINLIMYVDLDKWKRLHIMINSPGGSVFAGLALYDTLCSINSPLETICTGMAASMASIILLSGHKEWRGCFKHGRIMIHQPAADFTGNQSADQFHRDASELLRIRELITQIYSISVLKPKWVISLDLERDLYMSSFEAKKYGLVHTVYTKENSFSFVRPFFTPELQFPPLSSRVLTPEREPETEFEYV